MPLSGFFTCSPDWFIIENVDAIEEGGEDVCALDQMLVILQNAGYDTQPYKLHAQDYVLPQGRQRVFMLGIRRPAKHIAVESYDQLVKDINNFVERDAARAS